MAKIWGRHKRAIFDQRAQEGYAILPFWKTSNCNRSTESPSITNKITKCLLGNLQWSSQGAKSTQRVGQGTPPCQPGPPPQPQLMYWKSIDHHQSYKVLAEQLAEKLTGCLMQAPRSHARACLSRAIQIVVIPNLTFLHSREPLLTRLRLNFFARSVHTANKETLLIVLTRRFRLETVLTQCSLVTLPAPTAIFAN